MVLEPWGNLSVRIIKHDIVSLERCFQVCNSPEIQSADGARRLRGAPGRWQRVLVAALRPIRDAPIGRDDVMQVALTRTCR